MLVTRFACAAFVLILGPTLFAQDSAVWEVGGAGSFGFSTSKNVAAAQGTAKAGFSEGPAFSGYLGHTAHRFVSGEIRYTFQMHDLKLSSGGTNVNFGARSQAIHYDILIHHGSVDLKIRPFVAVGGGIRYFEGTGAESAFQPLSNFAILTKTNEWKGMASVGGGIKVALSENATLRVEARDYISPFPKQVITPGRNASIGGWIHNIVPLVGISYTF